MWHYTEGITNYDPIWPNHGIRIMPGPSSLWLDAHRQAAAGTAVSRLRHAGTLEHIAQTGQDYTWFMLNASDHREGVRAVRVRSRTPT